MGNKQARSNEQDDASIVITITDAAGMDALQRPSSHKPSPLSVQTSWRQESTNPITMDKPTKKTRRRDVLKRRVKELSLRVKKTLSKKNNPHVPTQQKAKSMVKPLDLLALTPSSTTSTPQSGRARSKSFRTFAIGPKTPRFRSMDDEDEDMNEALVDLTSSTLERLVDENTPSPKKTTSPALLFPAGQIPLSPTRKHFTNPTLPSTVMNSTAAAPHLHQSDSTVTISTLTGTTTLTSPLGLVMPIARSSSWSSSTYSDDSSQDDASLYLMDRHDDLETIGDSIFFLKHSIQNQLLMQ